MIREPLPRDFVLEGHDSSYRILHRGPESPIALSYYAFVRPGQASGRSTQRHVTINPPLLQPQDARLILEFYPSLTEDIVPVREPSGRLRFPSGPEGRRLSDLHRMESIFLRYPDRWGEADGETLFRLEKSFISGGTIYRVYRLGDRMTLKQYLSGNRPLDRKHLIRFLQILEALAEKLQKTHENGALVLSVSPDSVYLMGTRAEEDPIRIAFFPGDGNVTAADLADGYLCFREEPGFCAPEVRTALRSPFLGTIRDIGTESDVFSIAAVLYYALTGRIYLGFRPETDTMNEVRGLRNKEKVALAEFLRRNLSDRIGNRTESAEELAEELAHLRRMLEDSYL